MPFVGLDISDDALRFVAFKETRRGLELDRFGEMPLARGIVESGEIQNVQAAQEALRTFAEKHRISFARVSLPEEKAYIVRVRLPRLKRSEIRSSLELQFEEQIPIPPQEAVFDYDIISESPEGIDIALAALPAQTAQQYLDVFSGTDIMPVAFEIESEAISRAAIPTAEHTTTMVVDVEKTKTGISISSDGVVRFTSSLRVGGEGLVQALAKNMNQHFDEALQHLRENGIPVHDNSPAFMSLIPVLSILRDEINKHYVYWHSHEDQEGGVRPAISNILLCGEYANIPGLADYLASGLRMPVELANIMGNITSLSSYIPDLTYEDSFRYVTSLGLALPRPQ